MNTDKHIFRMPVICVHLCSSVVETSNRMEIDLTAKNAENAKNQKFSAPLRSLRLIHPLRSPVRRIGRLLLAASSRCLRGGGGALAFHHREIVEPFAGLAQ